MVPAQDIDNSSRRAGATGGLLQFWVRAALLAIAFGIVGVFVVAWRVNPYDQSGNALTLGSHESLGMPPCRFLQMFGRPCPTCGMTTSFALLVRGDLTASLRANFAGTAMAIGLIAMVPWMGLSAIRGRWIFVRAAEWWILLATIATVALALVRWSVMIGVPWLLGYG